MIRLVMVLALAATLTTAGAARAQAPVGSEFQINVYTTAAQSRVDADADAAGNFVAVWTSDGQDGDKKGVFGRRFDGNGMALGPEFQVNVYTTGYQSGYANDPAIDVNDSGEFVVVWGGNAGGIPGIIARRYDSGGTPLGGEFQVNAITTQFTYQPAVGLDGDGNFVVVWAGGNLGFNALDVFARRFDNTGAALGPNFQVNTYMTYTQERPAIAMTAAGDFVVTWSSAGQDGANPFATLPFGVYGRAYDSAGSPAGGEFAVNTYTTGSQESQDVVSDTNGDFVVVWSSDYQNNVVARRFDASGTPLTGELPLSTGDTATPYGPAVTIDGAGNIAAVWTRSEGSFPDHSFAVFGRRLDATGAPLGGEFQLNAYTTSDQVFPVVVRNPGQDFTALWASVGQDGSDAGIFGQRFTPAKFVLGKSLLVRDPNGMEDSRSVVILGKESPTNIGPSFVGDPTVGGATLRVITKGTTASDQTFVLDAAGWETRPTGYRYSGPTGADLDSVQRVLLSLASDGTAVIKVILRGRIGTQPLDVVPPFTGFGGGMILAIDGGATYCVAFGGAAGGATRADRATVWKVRNPDTQACPGP